MEEKHKIDIAIFRYSIIHDFMGGVSLEYGEKQKLLKEKCARKWAIPFSCKTSISPSTILRWVQNYNDSGRKLESLYPKGRNDKGKQRALNQEISLALIRIRQEYPDGTIPFIINNNKRPGHCSPEYLFAPFNSLSFFSSKQSNEETSNE